MATEQDRNEAAERSVQVSYVPQGFGLALVVDGDGVERPDGEDPAAGVLRNGTAVITLEIPRPDGTSSVLSWDPAEVAFDPINPGG
jgi:hypothetical protein